jgi:vacuolar-type H+-ATPase subunit I/STV1
MPTKPETTIGDFQRPKKVEPVAATSATQRLEEKETLLEREVKSTEEQLRPLESYEEALEKAGISKDEAATIVDDVLLKGFYSETIPITSRIKVRLRTRSYSDTMRVNTALDVLKPMYQVGYDEIVYRYSLAASLEYFAGKEFKFPTVKDDRDTQDKLFEERLKFLETQPEATVLILFEKLRKFDEKVRTVLKEGAIENF